MNWRAVLYWVLCLPVVVVFGLALGYIVIMALAIVAMALHG